MNYSGDIDHFVAFFFWIWMDSYNRLTMMRLFCAIIIVYLIKVCETGKMQVKIPATSLQNTEFQFIVRIMLLANIFFAC